jgi:hypothetical protein
MSSGMLMSRVGQGAGQRTDQVIAPVLPQPDFENIDLEHVTGICPSNGNRSGQYMSRHHALVAGMHLEQLGRNVKPRSIGHHVRAAADGVDGDLVAALDCEHRLQLRFEKTPMAGRGT